MAVGSLDSSDHGLPAYVVFAYCLVVCKLLAWRFVGRPWPLTLPIAYFVKLLGLWAFQGCSSCPKAGNSLAHTTLPFYHSCYHYRIYIIIMSIIIELWYWRYSMRPKNVSHSVRSIQLLGLRFIHVLFSYCFTRFTFHSRFVQLFYRSFRFGSISQLCSISHKRFRKFCPRTRCNFLTYLYAARHSARTTAVL